MRRLLRMIGALLLVLSLIPITSSAIQADRPYPEGVFFDPDNSQPILAQPGALVSFIVQGVSMSITPQLEVRIPPGLKVARESDCSAYAVLDPSGAGNQNASRADLICMTSEAVRPEYSAIRALPTEAFQATISYNVFLSVSLRLPSDTSPGVVFEIQAPLMLGAHFESLFIEVIGHDGSHVEPLITPTPPAEMRLDPPQFDTGLMLLANVAEASPGDTVAFEFSVPRSATWNLDSYALYVYAQESTLTNVGEEFIDQTGALACSQGTDSDPVAPSDRAVRDPFPRVITVKLGDGAITGSVLLVCVEMVGLDVNGGELFSWNVAKQIAVR